MKQTCIVCGSKHFKSKYQGVADYEYDTYHSVDYVACKQCGLLVQKDPLPVSKNIPSYYPTAYRNHLQFAEVNLYSILKKLQVWSLTGKIARFIANKQDKVLEIGCGSGMLLIMLKGKGFTNLWGNDISAAAANVLTQKGIIFKRTDVEKKFPFNARFGLIILNNCFEHFQNPKSVLTACRKHLSVGGKIIIVTPNNDSAAAAVFKKYWNGLSAPRHFFVFNMGTFGILRKALRFHSLKFYPMPDPMNWAISLQNIFQGIPYLRTPLKNGLAWYTIFLSVLFLPISALSVFGKKSAGMMCIYE